MISFNNTSQTEINLLQSENEHQKEIEYFVKNENYLLSLIITYPHLINKTINTLNESDLENYYNKRIIEQIIKLEKSEGFDSLNLISCFNNIPDVRKHLVNILSLQISLSNFDKYLEIVKANSILKKAKNIAGEILQVNPIEKNAEEITNILNSKAIDMFDNNLNKLDTEKNSIFSGISIGEIGQQILEDKEINGYEIMDLESIIKFRRKETTIIAARPGIGKTAWCIDAIQKITNKFPELTSILFSYEMSVKQLCVRFLSNQSEIDITKILNKNLNEQEKILIKDAINNLKQKKFYICEQYNLNINGLKNYCRILHRKGGLDFIFLDYIQLMATFSSKFDSLHSEINYITREIKKLATELNCVVVILSQVSRSTDQNRDSRPTLSNLKSSGALEEHSDNVIFLHRERSNDNQNVNIIVAKQRNGPLGEIKKFFETSISKFL